MVMKNHNSIHPLQSAEWEKFREKTGVKVIRINGILITVHKIPHTSWTIGYIPKGPLPAKEMILKLKEIGKQEKCIFIQLEPNVVLRSHSELVSESNYNVNEMLKLVQHDNLFPAAHPLFTKYTFVLDLTKNEQELLAGMHPKTRYNIKIAQKHGVKIIEDNSDEAFETYLQLTKETTKRQGFYAHTEKYHRLMWNTLRCHPEFISGSRYSRIEMPKRVRHDNLNKLTAHLFLAKYQQKTNYSPRGEAGQRPITLAAWILFVYKDTLYYPYGASSALHRETMASNLLMWEVIKFGKKLGLKKFDMWGALGPAPSPKDPWFGFHRFKQGYGGKLVEFVGSFDLIVNPMLYQFYKITDKLRWLILKLHF